MAKLKIRPEVQKFAEAMERILREHDRYKAGWEDMHADELKAKLYEEVREVADALEDKQLGDLKGEVTDIANICMMIWSNAESKVGIFGKW